MEKFLKNLLKKIKLSESTISTLLGAAVILIVGLLIFNYFKAEEKEIYQPQLNEQLEEQGQPEESKQKKGVYQVEKSDSLWKISQKLYNDGYLWVEIARENKLTNPDMLVVGQELKLPELEQKEKVADTQKTTDKTAEKSVPEAKYTVKKGDSLWKICVEVYGDGYKWPEVARKNNLANPDYLEVGMELELPAN